MNETDERAGEGNSRAPDDDKNGRTVSYRCNVDAGGGGAM
jgi:hypothetical protein